MDDDQQFCLRWNNHQSTLVAVFDTLLENGTLVDCTLAAEGKYLNAHKVVLSACSPYFEALLSKHFDKHPIVVLKDVKFQELKAMMDYMYRGEVNISQDQLGALLKAAESLQIKGLSDNKRGETERKPVLAAPTAPKSPPPAPVAAAAALPKVQGLTIEQRRDDSREGSASPGPRKKKRLRRRSDDLDNHDASNSSESHSLPASAQNAATPAKMTSEVPEPVESKADVLTRHKQPPADEVATMPVLKEKLETHSELMLEPKSEYVDEMNEDSIEDLTLDDDDLSNMEQMDDQAGPSHGNAGEGSSQGFGGWHMGNQSQDEVFLAAQEAVGAHRDSQDLGEWDILPETDDDIPAAPMSSLPEKSKAKYEVVYNQFGEWRVQRSIAEVTENALLEYFEQLATSLKSPSLWAKYSMLKATLIVNDSIDISKYSQLIAFLKRKAVGYIGNPAKTFTKEEIFHFFMEAPDENYLCMKVALMMGIAGGLSRGQLTRMTVDDIDDMGSVLIVKIPDAKPSCKRTFIVTAESELGINLPEFYRKYAALRPLHTDHNRFFLFYKGGKCSKQVIGVNTFGKIPYHIATYLQLPDPSAYKGQSFRRYSNLFQ